MIHLDATTKLTGDLLTFVLVDTRCFRCRLVYLSGNAFTYFFITSVCVQTFFLPSPAAGLLGLCRSDLSVIEGIHIECIPMDCLSEK